MKLNRAQLFEFEQALLSAYPTTSSLTRMLKFELDEHLTQIAGGGNLTDIVFNLIIWAQSKGRIKELITKSHDFNPGNAKLSAFASQFSTPPSDEPAEDSPNSSATQSSPSSQAIKKMTIRQMRQELNQNFDDVQLDDFCLEYFPEVYDRFSSGMRRDRKITLLLDHCRRVNERKVQFQIALQEWG